MREDNRGLQKKKTAIKCRKIIDSGFNFAI